LLLAVLSVLLVGQQVQISYVKSAADQQTATKLTWIDLATILYASNSGAFFIGNGTVPSSVAVLLKFGNSTCMSADPVCQGYDYYSTIDNVCQNTTYYGTCNFTGTQICWFDIITNAFFTTQLQNVSIRQGQTVQFHGNWSPSAKASISNGDNMVLIVQTSGGLVGSEYQITLSGTL
jgi:hypothetical protein